MQFRYVVTGLLVTMSLAGCQRTSSSPIAISATAPLQASLFRAFRAVSFRLQAQRMPRNFRPAPAGGTNMASRFRLQACGSRWPTPATALDVTKESMVGNWRVNAVAQAAICS